MSITYSRVSQRPGEGIGVELRIGSRARNRTHIDEQIDAYLLQ
jgi:hypothetical protein